MADTLPAWLGAAVRACGTASEAFAAQRLSVLIFHRVLPEVDPLFPGEMHARRFDTLLSLLARGFQVLTLGEAVALRAQHRLPPRAAVITFDDGYADNATVAMPLLQRHGLKATFFIASGFLDGGRMWNDSVIECLRRCALPSVDLTPLGLGVMPLGTPEQRRAAAEPVLMRLKYQSLADRERELQTLHGLCGRPTLPQDLMLTREQLRAMHRAGMEIGGHTVHHPILQVLPDDEAEAEIRSGREALQDVLQAPVEVFAYPNGRPGRDYDGRHAAMVERLGFRAAVSTAPGVVTPQSDRFQLPRFTPWDQTPLRWAGRLLHQRMLGTRAERAPVPA